MNQHTQLIFNKRESQCANEKKNVEKDKIFSR